MARRRTKLDTEIQRLYGLPLSEFTAARKALAKQLRKAGDRADAEEVSSLPKPTVSAWAVNHLFTAESEQMDSLLTAGEGARKALQKIFSGGDPGTLRDAIQEARDLANRLRDRAVAAVAAEGRPPGQAIIERIATNLQSLAFSPAAEPVVERGWLDVDLPPPGFEVLAGLQLAAGSGRPKPEQPQPPARPEAAAARKPPPKPKPDRKPARPDAEKDAEKEKEEAQTKAQREREEVREREHRERLSRAQSAREEAAGRADFQRRKAEQAEQAAEAARERYEEAERIADEARKRAAEAKRALAKATKAVQVAKR